MFVAERGWKCRNVGGNNEYRVFVELPNRVYRENWMILGGDGTVSGHIVYGLTADCRHSGGGFSIKTVSVLFILHFFRIS